MRNLFLLSPSLALLPFLLALQLLLGVVPRSFGSCILPWFAAWAFCWLLARLPLRFAPQIVE